MGKINPEVSRELKRYGAKEITACYNCGNCTAICSLSDGDNSFPREMVRNSVLGLEDEIKGSLKPWLCYYCGECSSTCPRNANPGELMMALRRWLSGKYDWTGLSAVFYKSLASILVAFAVIALGVVLFAKSTGFNLAAMLHYGHLFEQTAIGGVFLIFLLPGLFRMWRNVIFKQKYNIPLAKYFTVLPELFIHMFTQKRSLGCDDNKLRWLEHLILVFGYILLLFTTVALNWFGTDSLFVIGFGYLLSAIVFIISIHFSYSRSRKKTEVSKFSRPSDWFFVIWLSLIGLTAFLVRLCIDLNMLNEMKWVYIIHLVILAQWALIIVPFGKWTHFLYRSFAMYFQKLISQAK